MISLKAFALAQTWNEDAMDLSYDADSTSRPEDEIEIDLDLTDGNLQDVRDEDMVENLADCHDSSKQHSHSNVQDDGNSAMERHVPGRGQFTIDHGESTGITAAQYLEDAADQDQVEEEDVIVDDLLDETDDATGTLKDVEGGGDVGGSSAPRNENKEPDNENAASLQQQNAEGTSQGTNDHILPTDLLTRDLDSHYQESATAARLSRRDESSFDANRLRLRESPQLARVEFQESDRLGAFDSVPSASQPLANSSSTTVVPAPKSPAQRALIRVPIHVTYQETEMSLFPSLDPDQDQTQTYLLEDDNLFYQRIKILMQACRSVLGDSIAADDELILSLPDIDLHITEPSTVEMDMSLSDVVDLHVQLHANDGREETPSLYSNLTSRPNPLNRWNDLKTAVREGKGINSVQMDNSFTYENTEPFPLQDIGASAMSKADGMSSDKDERRANLNEMKSPSSAAIGEIMDENIYLDAVEDLSGHGNNDDPLETEGSTRASNDAAAYMEASRASTPSHFEATTSSSQKSHQQSNRDEVGKDEDTHNQDSIQQPCDSPQLPALEDEGSSNQMSDLNNQTIPDEALNHWVNEDGYATEHIVEQETERTEAVLSNPDEIEDLEDWDDEEDREAAADEDGDASSTIPLTENHEVFTKLTYSGDDPFSVHQEDTNEHEGVCDGQQPSHGPPVCMTQDHEVAQTYDVGSADDTLPGKGIMPTGISEAAIPDNEHYQDAPEPFATGAIGSGSVDTVTLGGSSIAVTDNEAEAATKSAGMEDTKDTAPSGFLDFAASDEDDGNIVGDEKLPGDVLNHSTSIKPPALASALLKRARNAIEDETSTGADLHDVKRARSSQQSLE